MCGLWEKKNQFDNLPCEIKHQILSRVPVKTLSQFRFVSKYWYNFINDPFFIDLHHSQQLDGDGVGGASDLLVVSHTTKEFQQQFYLLSTAEEDDEDKVYNSISSSSLLKNLKPLNIDFDGLSSRKIKLMGSSNGLMCISIFPRNNVFYICNPVTREILKLPEAPDYYGPSGKITNHELLFPNSSGFAFYAPTREYKIVRTWYFYARDTGLDYTGIEIHTIGSATWRRIDKQDIICTSGSMHLRLPKPQIFINGALHWELEDFIKSALASKPCIGAVNVGDEKFTSLQGPPADHGLNFRTLISLRQCLSMTEEFEDHMVIWIMKSYGVVSSWTKEHVIKKEMLGPLQTAPFFVVKTLKSRSVLLRGGKDYHGYYDLEKQEFKQLLIDAPTENLDIVAHTGSLISPTSIASKGDKNQALSNGLRKHTSSTLKRKAKKPLTAQDILGN